MLTVPSVNTNPPVVKSKFETLTTTTGNFTESPAVTCMSTYDFVATSFGFVVVPINVIIFVEKLEEASRTTIVFAADEDPLAASFEFAITPLAMSAFWTSADDKTPEVDLTTPSTLKSDTVICPEVSMSKRLMLFVAKLT